MKVLSKTIYLLTIAGLIGIQLATIIDNPDHISEPDPDCPICIASNTPVYIDPDITISFTPNIIFYLTEATSHNPYSEYCYLSLSIRAPPLTWSPWAIKKPK